MRGRSHRGRGDHGCLRRFQGDSVTPVNSSGFTSHSWDGSPSASRNAMTRPVRRSTSSCLRERSRTRSRRSKSPVREALSTGGVSFSTRSAITVSKFEPLNLSIATAPRISTTIDSGVARLMARELGAVPPADWNGVLTPDRVTELLKKFQRIVTSTELADYPDIQAYIDAFTKANGTRDPRTVASDLFGRESKVAGYLLFLAKHTPGSLEPLFFNAPASALAASAIVADPLLSFGTGRYEAVLSPIGIVHLFREYFFEFDSFLGSPAGHVWLSPGGTVELVEIRAAHAHREDSRAVTRDDREIGDRRHDAGRPRRGGKEENRENIKFGFSATGTYSTPIYSASATADLSTTRRPKRRRGKRPTDRCASRARSSRARSRRNFKTTFKTSTEATDTSSKRYVIAEHHRQAGELRAAPEDAQGRRTGTGHRRLAVLAHIRRRRRPGARGVEIRAHRTAARSQRSRAAGGAGHTDSAGAGAQPVDSVRWHRHRRHRQSVYGRHRNRVRRSVRRYRAHPGRLRPARDLLAARVHADIRRPRPTGIGCAAVSQEPFVWRWQQRRDLHDSSQLRQLERPEPDPAQGRPALGAEQDRARRDGRRIQLADGSVQPRKGATLQGSLLFRGTRADQARQRYHAASGRGPARGRAHGCISDTYQPADERR